MTPPRRAMHGWPLRQPLALAACAMGTAAAWLMPPARMAGDVGPLPVIDRAPPHRGLPCGVQRGRRHVVHLTNDTGACSAATQGEPLAKKNGPAFAG